MCPFDWNASTTWSEDAYVVTHPCNKCFYKGRNKHYVGAEWNKVTIVVWFCNARYINPYILEVQYDHKSRKVLSLKDIYRQTYNNAACPKKEVLGIKSDADTARQV